MLNNATGIPDIAADNKNGNIVTGLANTEGIIPFIAPNAIATVTPGLLTFHELINKTIVVATTPMAAAPEPIPDKLIAKAIPTVETGVIIMIENAIAINIAIGMGAKFVNISTNSPIHAVTSPT